MIYIGVIDIIVISIFFNNIMTRHYRVMKTSYNSGPMSIYIYINGK